MKIAEGFAAIFAMLAAWAWVQSALLYLGVRPGRKGWIHRLFDRISTVPAVWNAIAAGLSAAAALSQAIVYVLTYPLGS